MRRLVLSVVIAMAPGGNAAAEQRHALHGLFCNTEEQIDRALTYMRQNVAPRVAAEMMNKREVACVYADRIHYVVGNPAMI